MQPHHNYRFRIWRKGQSGELNRRYFKLLYTAALRLGVEIDQSENYIDIEFSGDPNEQIAPHRSYRQGWTGRLFLRPDGHDHVQANFEDVNVVIEQREGIRPRLITFWPSLQHPDAHDSYTDPLVDIAMSQMVPDHFLEYVAREMHQEFVRDPGMSPAVHIQGLNQELLERVRLLAADEVARFSEAAAKALSLHSEALTLVDEYKVIADMARAENVQLQSVIVQLQEAMKQQSKSSQSEEHIPAPAVSVTKPWKSKTGSSYVYVGIQAHISSVARDAIGTTLTYLDKFGDLKVITDFGPSLQNAQVFSYLKSREGKRAVFLVTQRPGGPLKLASDTMLLNQYVGLWSSNAEVEKSVALSNKLPELRSTSPQLSLKKISLSKTTKQVSIAEKRQEIPLESSKTSEPTPVLPEKDLAEVNKFNLHLQPGHSFKCLGCGFSDIITQKGINDAVWVDGSLHIQEFKFSSAGLACPECYQHGVRIVRPMDPKDLKKSEFLPQSLESSLVWGHRPGGLCWSCKHTKQNGEKLFCLSHNKDISSPEDVTSCPHFNSKSGSLSFEAWSVDRDMRQRAEEQQAPDKFATDSFKFFNKIKRK